MLPEVLSDLRKEHPEAEVTLWAQDEARIGLVPHTRRIWAKRGQQPIAASDRRYVWLYLYGFVRPTTGDVFWLTLPCVSNEAFSVALEHFARQLELGSKRRVLLVVDGAGFHRGLELRIPEGVHLHFLPPYSPELQPVEQLWPLAHESHANKFFADLDLLEETLLKRCSWLQEHKDIISGRTLFHWWPKDQ